MRARRHDPADAEGWDRLAAALRPLLAEPLRDLQDAAAHRRLLAGFALRAHGGLGDLYFHSDEAKATISAWGMHIDFGPPTSPSGALPVPRARRRGGALGRRRDPHPFA